MTTIQEIVAAIRTEPDRNLRAIMTRALRAAMIEPKPADTRSAEEIERNAEAEYNAYIKMLSEK